MFGKFLPTVFKTQAAGIPSLAKAVANDDYFEVRDALNHPYANPFEGAKFVADKTFQGKSPLIFAIEHSRFRALKALLENPQVRKCIDYQYSETNYGYLQSHYFSFGSAAHFAVRCGNIQALRMLSSIGKADLNIVRYMGLDSFTPLDDATRQSALDEKRREAIIDFLLENNARFAPGELDPFHSPSDREKLHRIIA